MSIVFGYVYLNIWGEVFIGVIDFRVIRVQIGVEELTVDVLTLGDCTEGKKRRLSRKRGNLS